MLRCFALLISILASTAASSLQTQVRWTPWYNTDQPTGIGDVEKLPEIRKIYGGDLCKEPLHIEVRTSEGIHVRDVDQTVHYTPEEGFWCINKEQNFKTCLDYRVRFLCKVQHHLQKPKQTTNKESYKNTTLQSLETPTWRKLSESTLPWSSWSRCDVTCGGIGIQRRVKRCDKVGKRLLHCQEGEIEEARPCGDVPCQKTTSRCDTSGFVTDTTNIPLTGVGIGLGTTGGRGLTTLTMTDENGRFYVEGICADSSSAHLVAHKHNYVTTRVHLKINESGNAVASVRMLPAVFPTIYKHPVDKARLVGQSVKFCCKARGTSKDHVYSWYHNGSLVDVIRYARDPSSLEIRDLDLQHAGEYWCKVRSHTSSKKVNAASQTAYLSVFDAEESACEEAPLPNYIKLPAGCETNETSSKSTVNSTFVDVGRCSNEICPTPDLSTEVCGEGGTVVNCCGPLERREIPVNCGEFTMPIYRVQRCGCQQCVKPVIKVQGRAYGKDPDDPLRFGFISIGKKKIATTSYDGSFSVDVTEGTKRLVLTFTDRFGKFVTTTKVLPFKERGGVTYHEIKMAPKSPAKIFHSREGNAVALSGIDHQESVAQVVTGPNSFYTKEGQIYTGKVRASVTFIDPRNETSYQEAPSDLSFVSNDGEALPLKTYGMFEVDIRDDDLNELNVGKARVVLDANTITSSSQIKQLKLWSLNPENGMWEVEDDFRVARQQNDETGPKRRKRFDQTFLVGNLEIRERRLYNLDVPAENRCWMKVRAYRSPEFVTEEQVQGVEIIVINKEPEAGFRSNPQAWGRFDTALTMTNGACVRVFCHESVHGAYKAIVAAKLDSSEELYAAPSAFPLDPQVVGVHGDVLKKLEYRRSDHNEVSGKKTTFQTNLPKPNGGEKLTGPIYPEENFRECESAPVTDNHFRFFRTEDYLYEYNTIYMDEHNCITWTPNYLNWWPKPLEYRACYIKVHIDSRLGSVVRAKSYGGMHPETKGKLYGIRDDRSVAPESVDGIYGSAACIEFKCSGMLYDMNIPDRTLVTVVPQGGCQLHRLNEKLTQYLTEHPPTVEGTTSAEFRMYAPSDPLGHNYGIYTVTDDDPLIAKKTALGRCYAGSSDVTSRIMNTKKGVGVYYRCSNTHREDELP